MSSELPDYPPAGYPGAWLPPRRRSPWFLILLLGGGGALLCCGGCPIFMWLGLRQITDEIEAQLRDNPALVEHVGEVQEFEMQVWDSIQSDNDEEYFYRVTGSKGSVILRVLQVTDNDGSEEILSAEIQLPGGRRVPVYVPGGLEGLPPVTEPRRQ